MAFPLNVIVASAVRTPVGRALKGTLRATRPDDLAAAAMVAAVERVPGLKPEEIEDVVLGCAMPEAEQGLNVARNAVFLAKFPNTVAAETVNRFCSSGLQAIVHGALAIQTGLTEVVLAGGLESMSMVPMSGNKVSLNPKLMDTYPEAYISMGHTAERVASRFGVSREEQDAFAVRSHERALAAIAAGRFEAEIVPVKARVLEGGQVGEIDFKVDECPRAGTTLEVLGKLKPAFKTNGTVTAGNSSPMNDGAAAAVLLSERKAQALGVRALGRLRGYAVAGVDPDVMGIGPVPAIRKLLAQTGLKITDIDLFELNEAFAAQAVYCARELGVPDEKLNVNGGAIALGHPLGCTGAKLTATLLHELRRRGGRLGIVSMCIGGGMGAAGLFEVDSSS
ncbi:MAG TPA: thiolase family protein [Polyangiaceae bacterium]|jgi:acetyl-CoA acyltransferase|nr:thiolase family protein [Polyangiaceae bacterium]